MSKIIGIDLGTTNSVVAVVEGDQPKVLTNAQGSRLTPSVVGFTEKGDRLVGQVARHQQVTNPENTVFSIKRFMGRRHSEVASEEKIVPYKVMGGSDSSWSDYPSGGFVYELRALVDAGLFALIAFGIYKMSRVAAVIGIALYLWGQLNQILATGNSNYILVILFTLYFIHAIRGTFAYHKLKKEQSERVIEEI